MQCRVVGMWGGFPKKDGPCSGFLIQENGFSILIDCGSGVVQQVQHYIDLNEINHVVLSHYHYDHYSDLGVFLFSRLVNTQMKKSETPLAVYGPESEKVKAEVGEVPFSEFHGYGKDSVLEIGPFTIHFFRTLHPVETYAMRITSGEKSIVYTADTCFTDELVQFSKDADLLIAEASLYDGMNGEASGHMTSKEAGVLAARSEAKKVILSHLPHYGDLNELLRNAKEQGNERIELAGVGKVIEI